MEKKDSDRRGFFSKIAKLGIAGGIGALLLGRLGEKTLIPSVHAVDVVIDQLNTGTGTTMLQSSVSGGGVWAFGAVATTGSGDVRGVYGESASTSGTGVLGYASASTGPTTGVWGRSDSTSGEGVAGFGHAAGGIGVRGLVGNAGAIPMVAQGATGQTASLQEWQNDAGTPLSVINKDGWMGLGANLSPARQLHIQGNQAVSRMDRDVDSAAFIFVRTAPGNFGTVWKSFMFGADASGVNNGRFVIGDLGTAVSGVSVKRLVIDNTGRVGIGTESPTELLHVAGNVKASGFMTGDIVLANGTRVTEEGTGFAFVNQQGTKVAVLDKDGNFHIRGKVLEDLQ